MRSTAARAAGDATVAPAHAVQVLVIAPAVIPSVVIGVLRPLRSLELDGSVSLCVRLDGNWRVDDIRAADVVVFCRNQSSEAYWALLMAKAEGKRVIYEIDDNFFAIPVTSAIGRHHRHPAHLHTTRRLFELADLVRVYTGPMVELAESFGASVDRVRGYFDHAIIEDLKREPRRDGRIRIALATARSPDPELESSLERAIGDIIDQLGDGIEVHFWRKPSAWLAERRQVVINPVIPDYERFIRSFHARAFDIGLAPLLGTTFHASKTNNKFREYGACCVAGIYSAATPYRECITDGRTGLIVDNCREAWREAMSRLIGDGALRRRIAAAAAVEVQQRYSYGQCVQSWRDALWRVMHADPRPVEARPLLYRRNIIAPRNRLGRALREIPHPQVAWLRGAEWRRRTRFATTIVETPESRELLDGPGTINWVLAPRLELLDAGALRSMAESAMGLILDVRLAEDDAVAGLAQRLAHHGPQAVVIAKLSQLAGLGLARTPGLEARINHPRYPRAERITASFGFVIAAGQHAGTLGELSLAAPQALWLEVLDAIALAHPLGRPAAVPEAMLLRVLPSRLQRRIEAARQRLSPGHFVRSHLGTAWYGFKWQRARWLLRQRHDGLLDRARPMLASESDAQPNRETRAG